jgi:hypothetical protein
VSGEIEHGSSAMYISAPTGSCVDGKLADNSLDNGTFAPAVGYTRRFSKTRRIRFALRHVAAFDVKNGLDGNPPLFTVAFSP